MTYIAVFILLVILFLNVQNKIYPNILQTHFSNDEF